MKIDIKKEGRSLLDVYSTIPTSFQVDSIYRLETDFAESLMLELKEEKIDKPFIKDYDKHPCDRPKEELKKFDIENWVFYGAYLDSSLAGCLILAHKSKKVYMLEGRDDIMCLWDIRIHPDLRRKGIGSKLFEAAVEETARLGCKFMKIETQNINVQACKFYKKQGCELGTISRYAYKDYPDEIQFVWYYFIR